MWKGGIPGPVTPMRELHEMCLGTHHPREGTGVPVHNSKDPESAWSRVVTNQHCSLGCYQKMERDKNKEKDKT